MSEELKPCPFPTDKPHDLMVMGDGKGRTWMECMECGARGPMAQSRAEAIAAWNRRASPVDARREALEEAAKVADEAQATAREEIAEEKAEEGYDPYAFGSGFLSGELTAAVNIAKAIRALKEKNNG